MTTRTIEFQMASDAFLVGFGNRLRSSEICIPDTFGLPDSPCTADTMLDKAVWGDATMLPSDSLGAVRVEVPLTLDVVEVAELASHGEEPTPPCQIIQATVRFDIAVEVSAGVPSLTFTFAGLEAPDLSAKAAGVLALFAIAALPSQSQPFNLGQLGAVLGETPTVAQGRIAVTPDGERMAIRFVLDGGALLDDDDWQVFDGGSFSASASSGWSIFLSKQLIEDATAARMADGLENSEAAGKIDIEAWPAAQFSSLGGVPTILIEFDIEAIDACVCFWGEVDLDVDVKGLVVITIPEPNVVQTDLHLSWDLDNAEVVCCAFTTAMLWPFLGTHLLQEEEIGWGEFFGGLLLLPVTFAIFVAVAHDAAAKPISSGTPDEWQEVSEGTHFRMRKEVDLSALSIGLTLQSAVAQSAGLVLSGSLTSAFKRNHPKLYLITNTFEENGWLVENPCDDLAKMVVSIEASMTASGIQPDPAIPLFSLLPVVVCRAEVIDDLYQQFTPFFSWSGSSVFLTIPYSKLKPNYLANRYPCRVRLVTSSGVRIVSLGSLPPISAAEVAELKEAAVLGQLANCREWVEQDFWHAKIFLPKWLPDPPTEVDTYVQQWQVVVTGLIDRERVTVQTAEGEPLAEFIAVQGSPPSVQLTMDVPARRGDERGIGLLRSGTEIAQSREIAIQQLVLSRIGTILVGAPVVGLCTWSRSPRAGFAVATPYGVALYEFGQAGQGGLVDYLPLKDVRGVLPHKEGLLAWGDFGLRYLGGERQAPTLSDRPVRDASVDGPRLYILDDETVTLHDRSGKRLARSDADGASSLAAANGVVLLAEPSGLRALDGASLEPLGRVAVTTPTALSFTRYGGTRAGFFVRSGGEEKVYAVLGRDKLLEVATYARRPLMADAARSRSIVVARGADSRMLQVLVAGRSEAARR